MFKTHVKLFIDISHFRLFLVFFKLLYTDTIFYTYLKLNFYRKIKNIYLNIQQNSLRSINQQKNIVQMVKSFHIVFIEFQFNIIIIDIIILLMIRSRL